MKKSQLTVNLNLVGRLCLFLLCFALACLNFLYIIMLWKHFGIAPGKVGMARMELLYLVIVPLVIVEYILISSVVVCLGAIAKGGFSKLKGIREGIKEGGITIWLLIGLVFGLVLGFGYTLVCWLVVWLVYGLFIGGLVGMAIFCFSFTHFTGLLFGLSAWMFGEKPASGIPFLREKA